MKKRNKAIEYAAKKAGVEYKIAFYAIQAFFWGLYRVLLSFKNFKLQGKFKMRMKKYYYNKYKEWMKSDINITKHPNMRVGRKPK